MVKGIFVSSELPIVRSGKEQCFGCNNFTTCMYFLDFYIGCFSKITGCFYIGCFYKILSILSFPWYFYFRNGLRKALLAIKYSTDLHS